MTNLVIYNHGKDSIPWGEKALAMQAIAKRHNYEFISPDYRPNNDPDLRINQLLSMDFIGYRQIIMVGSSMGAYVATVASELIKTEGLFLIAPAFYLPGYQRTAFKPSTKNIEVFHGWQDEVVPAINAWKFSQIHRAKLHMLDADHRLLSILPLMAERFDQFLMALK